jgi:cyclic pyranopterin phosphate synthase
MRIYSFEDIDEWLDTPPLAAKRALELAGCKVSLVAWRRMRVAARVAVTSLGNESRVDASRVRDLLLDESVPFELITAQIQDPSTSSVPVDVQRALGDGKLDLPRWRSLAPLDRWMLSRLSRRGRTEKLRRAFEEVIANEPSPTSRNLSSHVNARGEVHMVDVGAKDVTARFAIARAEVRLLAETVAKLRAGSAPKGDVLATTRVAAIMAAKRAPDIIPLCHLVALTKVEVTIDLVSSGATIDVRVEARDRTGVEMEAMVGAAAAALTMYDMLKGIDRGITFEVSLLEKSGGKSGTWTRSA